MLHSRIKDRTICSVCVDDVCVKQLRRVEKAREMKSGKRKRIVFDSCVRAKRRLLEIVRYIGAV